MDLGFTCPEVGDLDTENDQTHSSKKTMVERSKDKQHQKGVLAWIARSTTARQPGHEKRKGSKNKEPDSRSQSPNAILGELSLAHDSDAMLHNSASFFNAPDAENAKLKKKRKQLQRQKMSDIDDNALRLTP